MNVLTVAMTVPLALMTGFGYSKIKKKMIKGGPRSPTSPPKKPSRKPVQSITNMMGFIGQNCCFKTVQFHWFCLSLIAAVSSKVTKISENFFR
eukprot:14570.XXX_878588_878863_1 [CDS] Oithona nana genome sequencing.